MNHPGAAIRRTTGVHQIVNSIALHLLLQLCVLLVVFGQQPYLNNLQLDCYVNHTETEGYTCNGAPSCTSYLTFRSSPPYTSIPDIAFLLSANENEIATANGVDDVATFPVGQVVLVPVNCNCTSVYTASDPDGKRRQHRYYQHNATYTLKKKLENYLLVANDTYGGLTTCQALIAQNPVDSHSLKVGMKLLAPLMCACPSTNQIAKGFKYIISYLVAPGEDNSIIAGKFGVDLQDIYDANELTSESTIFPYNPILVPFKYRPVNLNLGSSSPAPSSSSTNSPPPPPAPSSSSGGSKWVYVGAGIGASLLVIGISSLLLCLFLRRRRRQLHTDPVFAAAPTLKAGEGPVRKAGADQNELAEYKYKTSSGNDENTTTSNTNSWSISSDGVRSAIESLTVYKFEELQNATGNFSESNRIKPSSSVYRGIFNGDLAAVKIMKANVSGEINILKQINHSSIVRLSGFCVQAGNTYLVYEYVENGCLEDWLSNEEPVVLSWKQRVKIAHDLADGLNYLHNYTNPPYIHKNLTSANVMLDGNMKAKMTNFGLARSMSQDGSMHMHLTRHVVGTKGYLAPELIESGVVTPKLDVFAFGMILGELLSGRVVLANDDHKGLTASFVRQAVDNVRSFIDPAMGSQYPLDLACLMAQLAKDCLHPDLNSRPSIAHVLTSLSKIHSASMDSNHS